MLLKCGDTICKTITIPSPSKWVNTPDVTVVFTIPEGLKIASTNVSHGVVAGNVWTIASILAGESPTLDVCFDINNCSVVPTGKTGTITVSTTAVESNENNNVTEYTLDYYTCEDVDVCVPTPGIDDVLAVTQAITAPRAIDIGNQVLTIGDVNLVGRETYVTFDDSVGEVDIRNMYIRFSDGSGVSPMTLSGGLIRFTSPNNYDTMLREGTLLTGSQVIRLPNAAATEVGQTLRVASTAPLPTGTQLEWASQPIIASGFELITTSGLNGDFTFPHGMGVTPDVVILQSVFGGNFEVMASHNPAATDNVNIYGVLYNVNTGYMPDGTFRNISWIAIKNPTP